ncbi:RNA-directed DNA polymerase, eukaryota, reverse transcriptase zinc-binding domain protein [Tanacetum coccineum]
MMNVGTILDDNLDVTKQQGKSSCLGNDTDSEGAKISKNGSDDDITIAKSSNDKDKTGAQWSNNELFQNDFYHNHEVEKRNKDNKKIEDLEKVKHELATQISIQKDNISIESQVHDTLKANFKHREDKYLNDILQLQAKNKDLENVVCKMGKSTETLRLLTDEQREYRDNIRKSGLGYKSPCVLSQANAKNPKLYSAYELCDENVQLHVFDSEETLEDAEKSRLKMKEFQKDAKVQELKIKTIDYTKLNKLYDTFVPRVELSLEFSLEQKYFSSYFISTKDSSNASSSYSSFETKPTVTSMPSANPILESRLCMEKPEPSRVPLWVIIMNVPLEAWNSHGISRLASSIGNLIIMGRITASMCEKGYGRASFARVLVEVDANKELVDNIKICYNKLGKYMNLRVEYAWKPPLCTHCRVFGHDYKNCRSRERTKEEKVVKVNEKVQNASNVVDDSIKSKDGWQEVSSRNEASTSRNAGQRSYGNMFGYKGGYNGSGRGSFNGRGGMSEGGGVYQRVNNEIKNNKNVAVKRSRQVVDGVQVMEDENSGKWVIRNSFGVLSDDTVEVGSDEWNQIKSKIDLACDLGMQIDSNEKKRWPKDLSKYYKDKCDAKVKVNMIERLKWRISKLQKDIVYGHQNVAMKANDMAEKQCVKLMKEKGIIRNQAYLKVYDEIYSGELLKIDDWRVEKRKAEVELFFYFEKELTEEVRNTWTDEMVVRYETLVGKKVDEMIIKNFNEGIVDCMEDKVAEETSGSTMFMTRNEEEVVEEVTGTARFMTKDEVSNVINEVDTRMQGNETGQVMHFLVRSVSDNKKVYVSFMYGETNVNDRRVLWKNLRDHFSIAGGLLWVLLGDFNIILDFNENSNVIPENVLVEGYAMFRLAKRLKFMKKHMRDFNKNNGDVYEKFRKLKVDLDRVQFALNKDPSSVHLKEEESIYTVAYKSALLDEELLLRQKSKIQWLKEGDSNSAYFHKMVKGKVIKNRIESVYDDAGNSFHGAELAGKFMDHFKGFFGTCDEVYPIEDPDTLFNKKLDADVVVELIKPVSDKEIKVALFDIEDNKASGPYGYSSKFFKAAWKVVGDDTCAAIKEFFRNGKLLGEFNASIISVVPKIVSPRKVVDYRPISCCNVVYKTISKIITNRLKMVLNNLVSENQNAFILGRQISNNILLKQELMRGYNWNTWGGSSRCAFKINIQKAYDTISWQFLKVILKCFGFHPVMIHWIMVYLTTASFSVCINGELHGFFKAGRGLRQGDLISPYLFTLVMEVLNLMVIRQVNAEKVLRRGLDEFSLSSGLHPSMSKSQALFENVLDVMVADIKLVMPFNEGVLPFLWSRRDSVRGVASVAWKDICKPRSQCGLGLKSAHFWNEALMVKHLWNIAKVNDIIKDNEWDWPIDWDDRFREVTNVPIPKLMHDLEDKFVWLNKKGMEKMFLVKEFGKLLVLIALRLWERLKPMAKLEGISNDWERNIRCFMKNFRDEDCLFKIIVNTVRMKLLGLNIISTSSVVEATIIWDLQLNKKDYHKRMVEELINSANL